MVARNCSKLGGGADDTLAIKKTNKQYWLSKARSTLLRAGPPDQVPDAACGCGVHTRQQAVCFTKLGRGLLLS